MFDAGEIHVLWFCGLPYVYKAALPRSHMKLLAAPVPAGHRYGNRPVYFSDVVVVRESSINAFADLRGRLWAYNEPRSSFRLQYCSCPSREVRRAGPVLCPGGGVGRSHEFLADDIRPSGRRRRHRQHRFRVGMRPAAGIGERLRVIETLGPSPMPPWVVSRSVPVQRQRELRLLLLNMHRDPRGRGFCK